MSRHLSHFATDRGSRVGVIQIPQSVGTLVPWTAAEVAAPPPATMWARRGPAGSLLDAVGGRVGAQLCSHESSVCVVCDIGQCDVSDELLVGASTRPLPADGVASILQRYLAPLELDDLDINRLPISGGATLADLRQVVRYAVLESDGRGPTGTLANAVQARGLYPGTGWPTCKFLRARGIL